jgi:co-chaperonin GroES (HSP10)
MLQATGKRFIIKMAEATKTTESGIILQNPLEEQPHAIVVSVGPKTDCGISVGQTIMVDWGRVGKIKFAEEDFFVVEQSNVIGVFEE